MKKPTIYLDTSVINFLFADDAPEKRDLTVEFFEKHVKTIHYTTMISPVVIDEINRTSDSLKRKSLLKVITSFPIRIIDIESVLDEINQLANAYIEKGIIPESKLEDALHVAISTIFEIDILVSWNFRHLANINRERRIVGLNMELGYIKPLRITTPLEVIADEDE